jgi:uncharacterized membrane protein YuzA (DUF378 family)
MLDKKIYMFSLVLVIIGALNWLIIGLIGINFLDNLGFIARIVYILVGLAALFIMFKRDTYLPFLGETVMPCSALTDRTPSGATVDVLIKGPAGHKVIYWASEPATEHLKTMQDWRGAYGDFMNVGVATISADGTATLSVRKPQQYTVPWKGPLDAHVHYRICGDGGMLGRVETISVQNKPLEAFSGNVYAKAPAKLEPAAKMEATDTFHPAPAVPEGFFAYAKNSEAFSTKNREGYKNRAGFKNYIENFTNKDAPAKKPLDQKEYSELVQKQVMSQLPLMANDISKLVQQMSKINGSI